MKGAPMTIIKDLLEEISQKKMTETINWLTQNTPYRLSGSGDDLEASKYITEKMREYGLEVMNEEFYTYNSEPRYSKVKILSPIEKEVDSLPFAHIKSTSKKGEVFELVYVGTGSYDAYKGINAKGKVVLVEVTYAPPVPEKARIAHEMGAAGIICMNWGNDEEVICNRGLKSVWGNPTEETIGKIPDIVGVGITRNAGLQLKDLYLKGEKVRVKITAISSRKWGKIRQPKGLLRGNEKSDQFILVSSHLDAWKPGVTCNATGNATTLEICRVLSKHREMINRNIYFTFWNGHEVAEAAGSTWFLDNYWDLINKNCIGYIHIDSTGVSQTKIFEIKSSDELLDFSIDNFRSIMGEEKIRTMALKKIGDQSFMGIGIPSVTQRMSFTEDDMEESNGATLGWWNHTKDDSLDKCNLETLLIDTKITLSLIYKLATVELLPYNLNKMIFNIRDRVSKLSETYAKHLSFNDIINNLTVIENDIIKIQNKKESTTRELVEQYNLLLMSITRILTNVFQTYADKYQQDSYGHTRLSYEIPLFADLERIDNIESRDSLEYGMLQTQLVKNKNRINDSLKMLIDLINLYKIVFKID